MLNSAPSSIAVSIIIPCYNQGEFLLDAIASVEACRDPIYEVIIVNDGSTDQITPQVMAYLKDKGYFIIEQTNQGLATARNNAIRKAQGRYILALDADNKIRPDYLYKGIEILDRDPQVGVVYGKAEFFGERSGIWELPAFDFHRLLSGNYIDACAVFRKELWEQCGGYDRDMPLQGYEDWDLWLTALEKGWKIEHVPEVLFDYRVRIGSMVTVCNQPENRKRLLNYVCTKHINLYSLHFPQIVAEKECLAYTFVEQSETYRRQLEQTEAELERLRQGNFQVEALQRQLERFCQEREEARSRVRAMESSKFWKLRRRWFQVKRKLGLPIIE